MTTVLLFRILALTLMNAYGHLLWAQLETTNRKTMNPRRFKLWLMLSLATDTLSGLRLCANKREY